MHRRPRNAVGIALAGVAAGGAALVASVAGALPAHASRRAAPHAPHAVAATTGASFAATHFTTKLAGYCPSTITVQTNWLPEADHGALYELIGGGGTMAQYSYEGPLGSSGVKLDILSGGPGDAGLETAVTLYTGNPVARVTPDLTMGSIESTILLSKKFPTVGVVSLQEHDPQVLIYDPHEFSHLDSIAAFVAAAKKGAKFYVSSLNTSYVRFLIEKGVPSGSFIGGYSGDLDKFVTGGGMIINQGYSDAEVYTLEHETPSWDKPVDYTYVYKLGLNDYDEVVQVRKSRLKALSPCLERLVPMIQQAEIDYLEHPAVVNATLARFNPKFGASYWSTPVAASNFADHVMATQDIVGNSDGGKGPVGAFDIGRMAKVVSTLLPIYAAEKAGTFEPKLTAGQIVTNAFIDPSVKFPT